MPMVHTRPLSIRATKVDAATRGTTSLLTGSMPRTSMASISSRIVRAPRSAQIAVAPAPATMRTVTIGPTWVTAPSAAPAPERSAAPISLSRMLSVKLTRTVKGMATNTVASMDTRAMNHDCSTNSRPCLTIDGNETNVSRVNAKNSPTPLSGVSRTLAISPPSRLLSAPGRTRTEQVTGSV